MAVLGGFVFGRSGHQFQFQYRYDSMDRQHFKSATQCRDDRDKSLTGCERFSGTSCFRKAPTNLATACCHFSPMVLSRIFATLCRRSWLPDDSSRLQSAPELYPVINEIFKLRLRHLRLRHSFNKQNRGWKSASGSIKILSTLYRPCRNRKICHPDV